jgi:hypothetical protein
MPFKAGGEDISDPLHSGVPVIATYATHVEVCRSDQTHTQNFIYSNDTSDRHSSQQVICIFTEDLCCYPPTIFEMCVFWMKFHAGWIMDAFIRLRTEAASADL